MRSESCANLALYESIGKAGKLVCRPVPVRAQRVARWGYVWGCLLSFAAMGIMLAWRG
jgi:hypothetical protein